ncbi:MAG: metallophosphoesterase family protein [Firmicutes bacterium]|nr:metallophosphoesterase family protein [Bacillota bacterium]
MKIAVFSDIHGNALALEAVIKDIDSRNADLVFCGGDLVGYGAYPNEVIDLIRKNRIPTIMGNYDEGVGFNKDDCGCAYTSSQMKELGQISLEWTKKKVNFENRAFLRSLLERIQFTACGKKILIIHGSPRLINEYLYADRPEESVLRIFDEERVDIIICGHTHLPFTRVMDGKCLINAGSVGISKDGDVRAAYTLIKLTESSLETEVIRVNYDVERMAQAIESSGLPKDFALALKAGR